MRSSPIIGAFSLAGVALGASIKIRQDEATAPAEDFEESIDDLFAKPALVGQDVVELEPLHFGEDGVKRIRARYGPLLVPGIGDPETMGMKEFSEPMEMPCYDCFVTSFIAGLEFADGSNANADSGMWLHHTVLLNANQSDTSCPDFPSRFLASGNERTPVDFTNGGKHKTGVYIGAEDKVAMTTELMNESALEREAWLTLEWAYVPAATPGFQEGKALWLDVSGLCSDNSSVEVTAGTTTFSQMMMEPWTMPFDADLLANFGHMHDGGIHQTLYINGRDACDHVATYGGDPAFVTHVGMYGQEEGAPDYASEEGEVEEHDHVHKKRQDEHEHGGEEEGEEHEHAAEGEEHEHAAEGEEHEHAAEGEEHDHESGEEHDHASGEHIAHISKISYCTGVTELKAGDKLQLVTYYDTGAHPAMAGHHGGLEPVMGITVLYVLPKNQQMVLESDEMPAE